MIDAYFISGLGADERVFERLTLDPQIAIHHLAWIPPLKNETIGEYASRMGKAIAKPLDSIIMGLSFGGVMAIEIAKQINVAHVIIISSVKDRSEMPLQLNLIGLFKLHHIIPASKLLHFKDLVSWFFGVKESEARAMFNDLLDETDVTLVDWSSEQILNWQGNHNLKSITHIHGTADTVFPIRSVNADYIIEGGPHFMVFTHPEEVSKLLDKIILRKIKPKLT